MVYYPSKLLIINKIVRLLTLKVPLIVINRSLKTYLIILYEHEKRIIKQND